MRAACLVSASSYKGQSILSGPAKAAKSSSCAETAARTNLQVFSSGSNPAISVQFAVRCDGVATPQQLPIHFVDNPLMENR
jgi:hypothetical protein